MVVQAAVADPTFIEGGLVRGPWPEEVISRVCEGDLAAGRLMEWGTLPAQQAMEMAALPAVDADAICLTASNFISDAAAQTLDAGDMDGVIGRDRIAPCRTVTVFFDADPGWDTPTGQCRIDIYGHDALGAEIWDTVVKINGSGSVTLTTAKAFASTYRIDIEECNAATGTGTIGVSNLRLELSPSDYPGLSIYRAAKEPNTVLRNFADNQPLDILMKGRLMAVPEHAVVQGDQVYVRVLAGAGDLLRGRLTGQDGADTPTTYSKLAGAKWVSAAAAGGFAIVELAGA